MCFLQTQILPQDSEFQTLAITVTALVINRILLLLLFRRRQHRQRLRSPWNKSARLSTRRFAHFNQLPFYSPLAEEEEVNWNVTIHFSADSVTNSRKNYLSHCLAKATMMMQLRGRVTCSSQTGPDGAEGSGDRSGATGNFSANIYLVKYVVTL